MANETTMHGKNGLANFFRPEAIEALNTTDNYQSDEQIIRPTAWIWLLACILLLASLATWMTKCEIDLTVESPGIALDAKQIRDAEEEMTEFAQEKQARHKELTELYHSKIKLYQKHYLTRLDILHAHDELTAAYHELLESQKNDVLPFIQQPYHSKTIILAFVNYLDGKKIKPGMTGNIETSLSTHHHITAQVIGVSLYPISRSAAYRYLHHANLVDTYLNTGAPFLVKLQTNQDAVAHGTPVTIKIIYQHCTPLQLAMRSHHCE